jgi:DNA processing protein
MTDQPTDQPTCQPPGQVEEAERLARAALNALVEPGDPRFARIVARLGPVRTYEQLAADVDLEGLRSRTAERLAGLDPATLLEQAARLGVRFVVPGDDEWPDQLADLDRIEPLNQMVGSPLGLWVRGPARLADVLRDSVAVVGSRSATTYGTRIAADIAAHLAQRGTCVVSGAAYGIDQAAHRGALAGGGTTVAVLACGVDRAYPPGHKALIDHVAATGAVVSDLRPGCAPSRHRFLARNRLIAAMTRGTVVVEAAVRSGALNTASWAQRMQRNVMGVPGPVTSAPSEGVHEEIRAGTMSLVTRAEHVLDLVAPVGRHIWTPPRVEDTAFDRLDSLDRRVLEAVPVATGAAAASVARTAGLATQETLSSLRRLAAEGWVRLESRRWQRVGARPAG